MRYFIELAYKGTKYHGWQVQPDAITVQEVIEDALSLKLQEKVSIMGAGRTDTGVHASFFVAHFETQKSFDPRKLLYGLNHLVGNDIALEKIYPVPNQMHARFDAISRTYEYKITQKKDPFLKEITTHYPKELDLDIMNQASELLLNYTDFTSFSKLHTDTKTNNCKITKAFWGKQNQQLVFTISADRFLRNMVRAIVGTLLELGQKKISLDDFTKIIEAKDRSKAGVSAPPEGLFLTNIIYPKI